MTPRGQPTGDRWGVRRKWIARIIWFCMAVIAVSLALSGPWAMIIDAEVAKVALTMGFGLMGAVAGSYIFGAAWEDISLSQTGTRVNYDEAK